jgi:hypothetical protein
LSKQCQQVVTKYQKDCQSCQKVVGGGEEKEETRYENKECGSAAAPLRTGQQTQKAPVETTLYSYFSKWQITAF